MRESFSGILVPFNPEDLERWRLARGEARKALIPECCVLHPDGIRMILNQTGRRYFAETAAIRHFHARHGLRHASTCSPT